MCCFSCSPSLPPNNSLVLIWTELINYLLSFTLQNYFCLSLYNVSFINILIKKKVSRCKRICVYVLYYDCECVCVITSWVIWDRSTSYCCAVILKCQCFFCTFKLCGEWASLFYIICFDWIFTIVFPEASSFICLTNENEKWKYV